MDKNRIMNNLCVADESMLDAMALIMILQNDIESTHQNQNEHSRVVGILKKIMENVENNIKTAITDLKE